MKIFAMLALLLVGACATQEGYATMREVQTNMGINPGNQMVLPNSSAKQLVHDIQNDVNPEGVANKIGGIAAQYGDNYPAVAKQFAKLGLNPAYQVLASMTRPEDAQSRVDLAKALAMGNDLKDNLDKKDKTLTTSIDSQTQAALSDFTRTAMAQGSPRLTKTVNDAATALAYYYATQPGMDASTAARKAANALTARYDFINDMRVPKGAGADVEGATESVKGSLTPEILRPEPSRPGEVLTDEQKASIQIQQAKRGRWVTNEDGTGVVLLYPDGTNVWVRNSSPVTTPAIQPGEPSNIDPSVSNKAAAKKAGVQGNELNAIKVEAAQQQVQDKRATDWRRVEVYFKDAKKLAPAPQPPTAFGVSP